MTPSVPGETQEKPAGHAGGEKQPLELPRPITNREEALVSRFVNLDSKRASPDKASRNEGKSQAD